MDGMTDRETHLRAQADQFVSAWGQNAFAGYDEARQMLHPRIAKIGDSEQAKIITEIAKITERFASDKIDVLSLGAIDVARGMTQDSEYQKAIVTALHRSQIEYMGEGLILPAPDASEPQAPEA